MEEQEEKEEEGISRYSARAHDNVSAKCMSFSPSTEHVASSSSSSSKYNQFYFGAVVVDVGFGKTNGLSFHRAVCASCF